MFPLSKQNKKVLQINTEKEEEKNIYIFFSTKKIFCFKCGVNHPYMVTNI